MTGYDGSELDDLADGAPGAAPMVDGFRVRYGVITSVPDQPDIGNLAVGDAWMDAQAFGGSFTDTPKTMGEVLGHPMAALYVRTPVFRLGELILLDANDRDQFTRKPDKWSVRCETFDSIDDAVRRVREVTSP